MHSPEQREKYLVCMDCKQEFLFNVREQQFFQEKGYKEPKRCENCRKAKKEKFVGTGIPSRTGKRKKVPKYRSPFSRPAKGKIRQFG